MHCSGAWWSVCLPQWRTPCTSCSLRLCIQRMQVLGCHTARLSDLCCHRGCRSPTPWAALDATTINEISHADRAWAATAPREIKKKNLCHVGRIHMGGTSQTGKLRQNHSSTRPKSLKLCQDKSMTNGITSVTARASWDLFHKSWRLYVFDCEHVLYLMKNIYIVKRLHISNSSYCVFLCGLQFTNRMNKTNYCF